MALVAEFFPDKANSRRHPTKVECGWQVITDPDGTLLQLSTYGSDDRAAGKKVSQTIQLDRASAKTLLVLLGQTFPDLEVSRDRVV